MTAAKFTLPKSKSAYAMFPPKIQSLIDDAVEAVKDKPWAAAYHAVMDFREMEMASLGPDKPTDSEMETVDRAFRLMVTALLERLGAKAEPCSDPFQGAVFDNSALSCPPITDPHGS